MEIEHSLAIRRPDIVVAPARSSLTWKDVRGFLRRHLLVILTVFLATVATAYVTLSLVSEEYDTESRLLVKLGRENVDPPPTVRNTVLTTGVRREEIASEIQILRSPDLAARAVEEIGLAAFRSIPVKPNHLLGIVKFHIKAAFRALKDRYNEALIALDLKKRLDERQKAISLILERLDVQPEKDSDVIAVRMRLSSPELARRIQEKIIELYMQRRIHVRQYPGVNAFLSKESGQLRSELAHVENERNNWMRIQNLTSSPDQKSLLLRQVRDLAAEMNQTEREIEALNRQIRETKTQLEATPVNLLASQQENPNPFLRSLKEKLTALQAQRAHLLTKYQPESDPVKNLDEEIRRMSELVQKESATHVGAVTYQINPLRQSLEKNLQDDTIKVAGLRSKAVLQKQQIAELQNELSSVNEAENKLLELERERQLAERSYVELLKRKQDADISSELDLNKISNVSLISGPVSGLQPVYPRKLLIMGVVLLLGLLLGVAFAMLLDYIDDRVHDPRALEAEIELPYLGSVTFAARIAR